MYAQSFIHAAVLITVTRRCLAERPKLWPQRTDPCTIDVLTRRDETVRFLLLVSSARHMASAAGSLETRQRQQVFTWLLWDFSLNADGSGCTSYIICMVFKYAQ